MDQKPAKKRLSKSGRIPKSKTASRLGQLEQSIRRFFREASPFLSYSGWQGIGAIFSFLSLIVTIVITIYVAVYIFNLQHQQATANIHILGPIGGPPFNDIEKRDDSFTIFNDGPATGRNVNVVVISDTKIECSSTDSFDFTASEIKPTRIVNDPNRCEIYFDSFYADRSSYIVVLTSTSENPNPPLPYITVFGENVVEITR